MFGTNKLAVKNQKNTPKYTKEIKEQNLKFENEQLKCWIAICIFILKDLIPSHFYTEFKLEEILKKNDSLSSFKSIDKLYLFLTKLIEKKI